MKCGVCGKEISTKDKYCSACGTRNYESKVSNISSTSKFTYEKNMEKVNIKFSYEEENEKPGIGIAALVFSILGGWLGLVLAIVGLCQYKEGKNKNRCKIAIVISICWVFLGFIIVLLGA